MLHSRHTAAEQQILICHQFTACRRHGRGDNKMKAVYVSAKQTALMLGRQRVNRPVPLLGIVAGEKGKVNHAPQESIGGCSSPSSRPGGEPIAWCDGNAIILMHHCKQQCSVQYNYFFKVQITRLRIAIAL